MNRSWSVRSGNKISKINYTNLNVNDSIKEKTCIQADKDNEKKYRQYVERAHKTSEKWQNTGAKMNLEVPHPPKPNNYERLIEYRKKNVLRPAIEQSKATLYLYKSGYQLDKDYEAHQAIELANSLKDYSKNLKKQKKQHTKSKLEDVLNVKNMSLKRHSSTNSFDIDEFIRSNRSSPTDSSCSSDDSLSNSIEFTKQNELLQTINEFRALEMKNKTKANDLKPSRLFPTAPPAPSSPTHTSSSHKSTLPSHTSSHTLSPSHTFPLKNKTLSYRSHKNFEELDC